MEQNEFLVKFEEYLIKFTNKLIEKRQNIDVNKYSNEAHRIFHNLISDEISENEKAREYLKNHQIVSFQYLRLQETLRKNQKND